MENDGAHGDLIWETVQPFALDDFGVPHLALVQTGDSIARPKGNVAPPSQQTAIP